MKQYNRILFVAESGTSRAPMAAGILSEYTLKHPVTIECRGLVVLFPEPLNQKAEAVMISNGINWENFTSTQLEDEDFTDDTLVLTMEHSQLEKIFEKYPSAREENVYVLTELVGDELEILDPYGGSLQSYGLCYETSAVGDGCQIGYHPAGVVSSYQRYLVSFLYAAFLEEQVQFGYLLGHLEIGEGLLFEVVGERGQLPVLPEALLVYLDKVFLHHKRIRLNDKVRIKKT